MSDRRYGAGRPPYGTSHPKYGASDITNLIWGLEVDWNNDGVFSGVNEATRLRSFSLTRGRAGWFTTSGQGEAKLARNHVGTASFVLDNTDRRYDPYYAAGALYPNVLPSRDIRFRVKNGSTGSTYSLFRGLINDIDPQGYLTDAIATLSASDGWALLSNRKAITALRTNGTTDQAIQDVLTSVGWPTGWGSSLGTGSDTIPYAWVDNQLGYDAIHELTESEMGLVYIAGSGALTFKSRHDLADEAAATTLTDALLLNNPKLSKPWDFVKNYVRVQAYPRVAQTSAELWRLRETPLLTNGQTLTLWAEFQDSLRRKSPATAVVSPVATTDYTANSNADGTGVNRTANITVVATVYGASAKLVVTNGGANAAYITLLKIRGQSVQLLDAGACISEDATSQAAYGVKQLTLTLPFQQRSLVAQDFADWLVTWMKDPLPIATVQIQNRPTLQFAYDLGTYLTYNSAYLGVNRRFRICKIEHHSGASMHDIRTTWTLEPVDDVHNYWMLETEDLGELEEATTLAY